VVKAMGVFVDGRTFGADSSVGSTRDLLETRLPAVRARRRQLEDELASVIAQENAMVSVLEGLEALAGALLDGPDEPQAAAEANAPTEPAATPAEPPAAERAGAGSRKAAPGKPAVKKTTTRKAATPAKRAVRKTVAAKAAATDTPKRDAARAPAAPAKKATTAKAAKGTDTNTARGKTARKAVSGPGPRTQAPAARKPKAAATGAGTGKRTAPAETARGRRRLTDAHSVLAVLGQGGRPLRAGEVTALLGLDVDRAGNAVRTMLERLAKDGRAQRAGRGLYTAVSG